MTLARFERVFEIFSAAQELEGVKRAEYLDQACDGDPELRSEVEGLLGTDEKASRRGFLEPEKTPSGSSPREPEATDDLIDTTIGNYRIERRIGSGGMGNVYLAVRVTDYTQQVAIKLFRTGMDQRETALRFRNEMNFLAKVEKHPNIASLLDAGTTEDGLPYFVMEYVEGVAIDEYCDNHRQSIRERLELFLSVCDAVQFAHQNTIIHRDVKPSNILVTEQGVAKLIDFGIAKLTSAALTTESLAATKTGYRALTPYYASPEQLRGETITTATDVYSLGVVLYELLTGQRPHQFDSLRIWEVEQQICETDAIRPSLAVRRSPTASTSEPDAAARTVESISADRREVPRRLERQLSGDLDNIVMKALRKEPQRRYPSAQDFANDIARFLEGRPVRATRDTLLYRSSKFVRRNKVAVAVLVVIVLSVLGGTVGTATQAIRASRNAARAEDQARRANEEADRANREAHRASEQARVAHENLARAREAEREARQVADFMVGLFRGSDPIAFGGYEFGAIPRDHGELTARQMVERGAASIIDELSDQPLIQATLIDTIGDVYAHMGDLNTGSDFVERALKLRRENLAGAHPDLAESLHNLGWLRYVQGRYDESEKLLREAIAMRTELLGASSAETLLSKFMLAWVLLETDYSAEVEELLSTVAAARQSNAEGNVRDVAYAYAGLALLMIHKGQTESALENFQKAMQLLQQSNDESLEVFALAVQGMIQAQMGDTQGAVDQFHQALQLAFEVVGETHPAVVQLEVELAKFLIQLGDLDAAEATYRSALKRAEQSIGRQPRLAETLFELGDVKRDQGMIDEAEDFYRQALDIQIQYLGDDHPHVAYSTAALAAIAYFRGDIDEAKQMFQTARSILQSRLGDDTYQQLYPLCGLAVIAHGQDDGQEADRLFDEARRIGDRAVAGENLSRRLQFVANDVAGFGSELVDHDNPVPAERVLRLALTLRRAAISDTDWRIAQVENDLGACLVAAAQYEVAEPMLLRSQKILKTKFGNDHKYSQTALDKLVELYDAWGKSEKADKFRSQREQ